MELKLIEVSKTFKDKKAVKQVSFTLQNGVHGLLGANGSGKTTLMRMICGLLPMDGGVMYYDEKDALKNYDAYCERLGYMPQYFGYYPHYSVYEFLEYMCIVKGLSKKAGKQKIHDLLKTLNLEDKKKTKMKNLSGGMLKRVGIAQALLNDPKILILDEPTAGLDPKERIVFRNMIASLSQECIIILSTHIVSDIESIADDILVMKDGTIILQDNCENLLESMMGKVWEVTLLRKEAEQMFLHHTIVRSHNKGDVSELRIVADEQPHPSAVQVMGDLDDLYLYHFQEGANVWED